MFGEADWSVLMYACLGVGFSETQDALERLVSSVMGWLLDLRAKTGIKYVSFVPELLGPPHKLAAQGRSLPSGAAGWKALAATQNIRLGFLMAGVEAVKSAAAEFDISVVYSLALAETDAHACGRSADVVDACKRFGMPEGSDMMGVAIGRDADWLLLLADAPHGLYLNIDGIYNAPTDIIDIGRTFKAPSLPKKWLPPVAALRENDAWARRGEPVKGLSWPMMAAIVNKLAATPEGAAASTDDERLELLVAALSAEHAHIRAQFAADPTLLPALKTAMRCITELQLWGDEQTGELCMRRDRVLYDVSKSLLHSALPDIRASVSIMPSLDNKEVNKAVMQGKGHVVPIVGGLEWQVAPRALSFVYDIDAATAGAVYYGKDRFGGEGEGVESSDDENEPPAVPNEYTWKQLLAKGSVYRQLLADLKYLGSAGMLLSEIKPNGACELLRARHGPGGTLAAARALLIAEVGGFMFEDKDDFDLSRVDMRLPGSLFRKLVSELQYSGSAEVLLSEKLFLAGACALLRARHGPGGSLVAADTLLTEMLAPTAVVSEALPAKRIRRAPAQM